VQDAIAGGGAVSRSVVMVEGGEDRWDPMEAGSRNIRIRYPAWTEELGRTWRDSERMSLCCSSIPRARPGLMVTGISGDSQETENLVPSVRAVVGSSWIFFWWVMVFYLVSRYRRPCSGRWGGDHEQTCCDPAAVHAPSTRVSRRCCCG